MNYWRRKFGWYLMVIVNLLTLQAYYALPAVRIATSLGFILLGGYWWRLEESRSGPSGAELTR